MKPGIVYTSGPDGCSPVQSEGTIDGLQFYFRSRWQQMSIRISSAPDIHPMEDENDWYYAEPYGALEFEAGYAPKEDCIAFIERAAELWRNRK